MAQIEIGLGAVFGDEDLAVLIWIHRAGIDVDIGVELLDRHADAAAFRSRPSDAAVMPLPSELTTPPVKKIYFAISGQRIRFAASLDCLWTASFTYAAM